MLIAVGDIALINNDGAPQLIYCCLHATCAYEVAGSAMYTHGRAVLLFPCTRPFILLPFQSLTASNHKTQCVCHKKFAYVNKFTPPQTLFK